VIAVGSGAAAMTRVDSALPTAIAVDPLRTSRLVMSASSSLAPSYADWMR